MINQIFRNPKPINFFILKKYYEQLRCWWIILSMMINQHKTIIDPRKDFPYLFIYVENGWSACKSVRYLVRTVWEPSNKFIRVWICIFQFNDHKNQFHTNTKKVNTNLNNILFFIYNQKFLTRNVSLIIPACIEVIDAWRDVKHTNSNIL